MPYFTELPEGLIQIEGDTIIIDTNDLNLLNITNQPDNEFSLYDVESPTGTTLSNGDELSLVDSDENTLISGTYVGDITVSTASVEVGLGALFSLGATLNPLEGELFQDESGNFYVISEDGLDPSHLGVELTITLAGNEYTAVGADVSEALENLASAVEDVPLVGGTAAALIRGAGDAVQDALDTAAITVEVDETGTMDLTDEEVLPCFLHGTLIATPDGEKPVETLVAGDEILAHTGKAITIKWVGRRTVRNNRLDSRHLPVCIKAGSLGDGLPHSDLYVTADHGMIIDDMVINAGALVNGSSICFVDSTAMPSEFTYYHIETENHDEILANGAPTETFVDYIGRKSFDNHDEYLALYGAERIIPEMKRIRISARRQLPAYLCERLGAGSFSDQVDREFDVLMAKLKAA
ncbi:Hint domain-containing protein [Paracoccus sp. P2]|uniref:Hint domain-containing protein n=1 Tax=Paracoccus pantotrophus TaxID=82367 RepID=A0A7H9BU67_PARPN|nr:Hint domain-containing protein [Paracoccus pantotrophus]MDF3852870.1 Hint domain-containing protein [Paracoccus pantotrophus]QLH14376.1 Hint domain-containing protein [Paracoccus pantotrophus]RDD95679.1 hypothetical protein DTW92_15510 [Paracoccus pantotrophus]WGR64506.1 Hint domain-containing protein [Paracoccus pantotrophus]SFN69417.1 Hint domain-containing protein [Paracoccus pantotrophus]